MRMGLLVAAIVAIALLSPAAVAQTGSVLSDRINLDAMPCWAGPRDLASLYHVLPCGEVPSSLDRAREICLKRWWFPGGMRCAGVHDAASPCLSVNWPAEFETPECKTLDERWKASGGVERAKTAAEKAEREDREFVERVAREGK